MAALDDLLKAIDIVRAGYQPCREGIFMPTPPDWLYEFKGKRYDLKGLEGELEHFRHFRGSPFIIFDFTDLDGVELSDEELQ